MWVLLVTRIHLRLSSEAPSLRSDSLVLLLHWSHCLSELINAVRADTMCVSVHVHFKADFCNLLPCVKVGHADS